MTKLALKKLLGAILIASLLSLQILASESQFNEFEDLPPLIEQIPTLNGENPFVFFDSGITQEEWDRLQESIKIKSRVESYLTKRITGTPHRIQKKIRTIFEESLKLVRKKGNLFSPSYKGLPKILQNLLTVMKSIWRYDFII